MKRWLSLLVLVALSCNPAFKEGTSPRLIPVHRNSDTASDVVYAVNPGDRYLYKKQRGLPDHYYKIKYYDSFGYAYDPFNFTGIYHEHTDSFGNPLYEEISDVDDDYSYSNKPIHVNGHYRTSKNGKKYYVRPHYRSAPKKK